VAIKAAREATRRSLIKLNAAGPPCETMLTFSVPAMPRYDSGKAVDAFCTVPAPGAHGHKTHGRAPLSQGGHPQKEGPGESEAGAWPRIGDGSWEHKPGASATE
jgi:hypothetical protein